MKYMNMRKKFGPKLVSGVAGAGALVAAGFASADDGAIAQLQTAVTGQLSQLSGVQIAIGVILVGIAALSFCILKAVSMSRGRG